MAQMDTADSGGRGKGNKKIRGKILSTRVDLTRMVDLAFLLITFFMMTTTMNKPQVMQINMPLKPKADDPEPPKIAESRVMTMILGKDDMVWYYEGLENPEIKNASMAEMRPILINKREKVKNDPAFGPELPIVVIIKPTEFARYKNVVDAFDEMAIDSIQKYAMIPVSATELKLIDNIKTSNPSK